MRFEEEQETSSLRRMHHKQRRNKTMMLLLAMIAFSSSLMTFTDAFSTTILYPSGYSSSSSSSSTGSKSSTFVYTHPEKEGSSAAPSMSLEETTEEQKPISYPLHVIHQGHKTTINVNRDEPILQALERQSTSSDQLSLALSNIPHECRRGNCLTCASKIAFVSNTNVQQEEDINLVANIDNGLSPTIASELTKSGYVLTCCSYVTGPGVVLELDQNNEVWDAVYRQRLTDGDTKQVALEAQARLLRRVDEENVGRWKNKMEKVWSDE